MPCARVQQAPATTLHSFILLLLWFFVGNEPIFGRKQRCLRLVVSSIFFFFYIIEKNCILFYTIFWSPLRRYTNMGVKVICLTLTYFVSTELASAKLFFLSQMWFDLGCTKL